MGDAGLIVAVADAGPIIHLNEIGCLSLLSVFDAVTVPDAVWTEVSQPARVAEDDLLALGNIRRQSVPQEAVALYVEEHDLSDLHPAECESLFLGQQAGTRLVLTDDLAVRDAAQRLNLVPVGSLGVVIRAHLSGRVSFADAEQHLLALYETSTLFVTRTIVDLAIEQLRSQAR